jgi:hypothetical protein
MQSPRLVKLGRARERRAFEPPTPAAAEHCGLRIHERTYGQHGVECASLPSLLGAAPFRSEGPGLVAMPESTNSSMARNSHQSLPLAARVKALQ